MFTGVQPISCDCTVYLCVQEYRLSAITIQCTYVYRSTAYQMYLYSVHMCTGLQHISCDYTVNICIQDYSLSAVTIQCTYVYRSTAYQL